MAFVKHKSLLPIPWFTTSIFPGACPLVCVTSQKPVKGGRLDNVIFNEAEFSPSAGSICIGLDLSAVSAGSLCAVLWFDGWSDYPVTVIITWMHFGPRASSDQLIGHNFILHSSLDKELAHPSKLKWDSKVTAYYPAPGQWYVYVLLSLSTSLLIPLSWRLRNLNCLKFPEMFCRAAEFAICRSPRFPLAHIPYVVTAPTPS